MRSFGYLCAGLMILILGACSSAATSPTFDSTPTVVPPPRFISYTDESRTFSIDYPGEWDRHRFQVESVDEFLSTLPLEIDLAQPAEVFSVVNTRESSPIVSIVIEQVPSDFNVDEYYEYGLQGLRDTLTSLQVKNRQPIQIGELRGLMDEFSYDIADLFPGESGRWTEVQLVTKRSDSSVGWVVGCGFAESAPENSLDTCEAVVKSFRLLR